MRDLFVRERKNCPNSKKNDKITTMDIDSFKNVLCGKSPVLNNIRGKIIKTKRTVRR